MCRKGANGENCKISYIKLYKKGGIYIEEEWKEVKGFEGLYEVSNLGNVRGLNRTVKKSNGAYVNIPAKYLTKRINTYGYYEVKLSKNNCGKYYSIHRLVAEAFILKPYSNEKLEVNHIDCNRKNNNVDNLEWLTHGDNVRYSIKLGHHYCTRDLTGKNNPNYGNHKLREVYKDKELAKLKLARKGAQNGRCVKVKFTLDGKEYKFSYEKECAQFLIEKEIIKNVKLKTVIYGIYKSIKNNKPYHNIQFYRY